MIHFHWIISDLTKDSFTVGRATNCDYSLQAPQIKQKLLVQMSKRHFQITKNLSDMDSPVYIEVIMEMNWLHFNEQSIWNCVV